MCDKDLHLDLPIHHALVGTLVALSLCCVSYELSLTPPPPLSRSLARTLYTDIRGRVEGAGGGEGRAVHGGGGAR
jgi:hypothetical protein